MDKDAAETIKYNLPYNINLKIRKMQRCTQKRRK